MVQDNSEVRVAISDCSNFMDLGMINPAIKRQAFLI